MARHWTLLPPVEFAIYAVARVALAALQAFGRDPARTGRLLGRLMRLLDRRHVRIARRNLERAGLPSTLLPAVFENLGRCVAELAAVPRLVAQGSLSRHVRLERFDVFDRLLAEGRGAIVAIGHQANYELAGLAVAAAGYPLRSLARPIVNRWVDGYVDRLRKRTGQLILPREGALGQMIRSVRANEMLVVQIDLDAKADGLLVDFFGRPASTHRSPAVLSLKYGTPVVLVEVIRDGRLLVARAHEPIHPDPYRSAPDPVLALTQAVSQAFERTVRERPAAWWWVIDRWRGADKRISQESPPGPPDSASKPGA